MDFEWTGRFTFLSAVETQGRDLRESAATDEHDQDDALGIILCIQICATAAWHVRKSEC